MKTIKAVFAKAVFTCSIFLLGTAAHVNAQGTFTFCKSISDDVYPVEAVTEVSSGAAVYFHFAVNEPIGREGDNNITVGWVIHTVDENGSDNGFVNEYFTYFQPGCRRFCADEPFYFTSAGTYRVYAIGWDDRQLNHHTGNLTKYYAKNEITVK